MPAAVPALIAAGGAIAGGVIASKGAKSAAQTQADAEGRASQVDLDIFNKQTELQEPFRQNGLAATNRLSFLLGLPQPQGGQPQAAPSGTGQAGQASQGNPFAPHPEIPQAQAQGPVTEQNFNAQAYLAANKDVADFLQAHPGSATPWEHYNQHGRDEGRSLGLPTQQSSAQAAPPGWNEQAYLRANPDVAEAVSRGETTALGHFLASGQAEGRSPSGDAPGQGPQTPTSNDMTGFGSLNQAFNQTDFQADGAPKFAPFTQTPNLPTFNQQAPDVQNLASFANTPEYDKFVDLPAFGADQFKQDPGYAFRQQEQDKALQRAASASGGLGSGKFLKDAMAYSGGLASQEYGNAFDRYQTQRNNNLGSYQTNLGTFQTNRTNRLSDYTTNQNTSQTNYQNQRNAYDTNFNQFQVNRANAVNDNKDALNVYSLNRANGLQDYQTAYDRFQTNRGNVINPLLSFMGAGQQATNAQSAAAQNFGQQSSAAITAAGNARAAGQVGSASAINGAIGMGTNRLMDLLRQPTSTGSSYEPWQTSGNGMPPWYTP